MPKRYRPGDIVYMLESNWLVREVRIVKVTGDFAIIRFRRDSGIRLRISRLFPTREEAEAAVPDHQPLEVRMQRTEEEMKPREPEYIAWMGEAKAAPE